MKVSILGAGAFGLALGQLWHNYTNHEVLLWTPFEEEYQEITTTHQSPQKLPNIKLSATLQVNRNLEEVVTSSDVVVIALPCNAVRKVLEQVKLLNAKLPVVIVSKGLEMGSEKRLSEVYEEVGLKGPLGVLVGPTFAIDIIQNQPTGFMLATKDDDLIKKIDKLFQNTNIRLETTTDIPGVEYCSSIKNVLAILMGAIQTRFSTDSSKAYFFTRIYQEASYLLEILGAKDSTIGSLAGLGDLFLTCNSNQSRNYQYGKLLVENRNLANDYAKKTTVEGKNTLKVFLSLLSKINVESSLLEFLDKFIQGQTAIDQIIRR